MAETLYRTGFVLEKLSSQSSSGDLDEALDILIEALACELEGYISKHVIPTLLRHFSP